MVNVEGGGFNPHLGRVNIFSIHLVACLGIAALGLNDQASARLQASI